MGGLLFCVGLIREQMPLTNIAYIENSGRCITLAAVVIV